MSIKNQYTYLVSWKIRQRFVVYAEDEESAQREVLKIARETYRLEDPQIECLIEDDDE